jgi:CubicO group peptidase (beta-lactamase class C family)
MKASGSLEDVANAQVGPVVPGISTVVVDPDRIRLARAFGYADVGRATPMTPESICNWFSMTKLVTATAAVQLADRGELDLDAPVHELYERSRCCARSSGPGASARGISCPTARGLRTRCRCAGSISPGSPDLSAPVS